MNSSQQNSSSWSVVIDPSDSGFDRKKVDGSFSAADSMFASCLIYDFIRNDLDRK